MDFDRLKAFLVFARYLNFTRAAKILNISQPALFKKVQLLGEELDMELYIRVGKALKLSRCGEELMSFAEQLEKDSADLIFRLKGLDRDEEIIFSSGQGAYLYLLSEKLERFQKENKIKLKLRIESSQQTIEAISCGKVDLGFTVLESAPAFLSCRKAATYSQVALIREDHPFYSKNSIYLRELMEENLILPEKGKPLRLKIDNKTLAEGFSFSPVMEVSNWELMIRFAQIGMGIPIVNNICKIPKGIKALPIKDLPQVHYYFIWSKKLGKNSRKLFSYINESL
jgi:DNA-binding transcriptional LysR family regulator